MKKLIEFGNYLKETFFWSNIINYDDLLYNSLYKQYKDIDLLSSYCFDTFLKIKMLFSICQYKGKS